MRRLVERMGQRNEAAADEFDTLALEWVRVAGVAPERIELCSSDSVMRVRGPTELASAATPAW